MPMKKCPTCGAVWYTDLPKCAFCGIEGMEQALPASVGEVMDRGKSAPPARAEKSAEPPSPDPPPAPAPDTKRPDPFVPPPAPEPPPAPDTKRPDPFVPAVPVPALEAPPAPPLPSAAVPLVFGLMGMAAAAVLPAAAFCAWTRIGAVLLSLAASLLIPFAPCAWWAGRRYEARCLELGFRPAPTGRAGRLLGTAVTFLLAAEGSAILFLAALRRLAAP